MDHEPRKFATTDECGQTTVEYGFMILVGLALTAGLAAVLGFVPQRVLDALAGALV